MEELIEGVCGLFGLQCIGVELDMKAHCLLRWINAYVDDAILRPGVK